MTWLPTLANTSASWSGKPVTEGPHDLWAKTRAIWSGYVQDLPLKTTSSARMGWG